MKTFEKKNRFEGFSSKTFGKKLFWSFEIKNPSEKNRFDYLISKILWKKSIWRLWPSPRSNAMHNTCNAYRMQCIPHKIHNVWNAQCMQCKTHAICNACNAQSMQCTTHAMHNACVEIRKFHLVSTKNTSLDITFVS